MARFQRDNEDGPEFANVLFAEMQRRFLVAHINRDLYLASEDLGQTEEQANQKIDDLFGTFAGEWAIFILAGTPTIITAIQNDATMPWLDTEYPPASGVTIRERLINRLTNG